MTQATQATRKPSFSERIHWNDFFRPWIVRLIFVGIGLLVGLYIIAPLQARVSESYLPNSYTDMPTGIAQFTSSDGVNTLLPVRIADTSSNRSSGFSGVGTVSLDNAFLLIAQSRETTRATRYNMENVKAPLEVAVIDATGAVISLQEVPLGTETLSVSENHRWLLVAKAGIIEPYGIAVGSALNPDTIQKLNF